MIKTGTKAHLELLQAGYGMSVTKAKTIIAERKADPQSWPYEMFEKASAMLEAAAATPQVISTRPAFKRAIR